MAYQITDKAMLVRLQLTAWTARKYDRKATREVEENHGANGDVGRFNKLLIAKEALARIAQVDGKAREYFYENSLPWMDDGYRLMPAANFLDFSNGMRKLLGERESAVREFVDAYPDERESARRRLNGLFDESDYPAPEAVAGRFTVDVATMPMPDASDFRVALNADEIARIQGEITERTQTAIDGAVKDLWNRLHGVVKHMVERLEKYRVTADGVENPFRDTLVENIRDVVALMPRLNVTGCPDLDRCVRDIESALCGHDAKELRQDTALRESVRQSAADILDAMQGYCG